MHIVSQRVDPIENLRLPICICQLGISMSLQVHLVTEHFLNLWILLSILIECELNILVVKGGLQLGLATLVYRESSFSIRIINLSLR